MGTREDSQRRTLRKWLMMQRSTKQKEKISAKNNLESYCFNMKSTMDEEKVKAAISDSEKKIINDKCDECIKWLDANQTAEKDEFEDKQKEIESVCKPITEKLYSGAGGGAGVECLVECPEVVQVE